MSMFYNTVWSLKTQSQIDENENLSNKSEAIYFLEQICWYHLAKMLMSVSRPDFWDMTLASGPWSGLLAKILALGPNS